MDPVVHVQVRQMQVNASGQQRQQAEAEAYDETDEKEIGPGHDRLFIFEPASGVFRTSMSRSARPGFSRISPRRTMHMRESLCFAMARSAVCSSESFEKRSAPLTS